MADEKDKASVVRVTVEHDGRTHTFQMPRPEGATPEQLTRAITRGVSRLRANVDAYKITGGPIVPRSERRTRRRPRL